MNILELARGEPVAVAGIVQATVALAITFGANISADQVAGTMTLTAALLALVVRANVSPTGHLVRSGQGKHEAGDS